MPATFLGTFIFVTMTHETTISMIQKISIELGFFTSLIEMLWTPNVGIYQHNAHHSVVQFRQVKKNKRKTGDIEQSPPQKGLTEFYWNGSQHNSVLFCMKTKMTDDGLVPGTVSAQFLKTLLMLLRHQLAFCFFLQRKPEGNNRVKTMFPPI